MSLTITLPLTDEQARSVVVAADAAGCEPWEMGAYVLQFKRDHVATRPPEMR